MYNSYTLKEKIKKLSNGDNLKSFLFLRLFFMEIFLKRISLSKYSNMFILKGGLLVSQMLGVESRVTKDIDVTAKSFELSKNNVEVFITDIINNNSYDNVIFSIRGIEGIMDNHNYPGIRVLLLGILGRTSQPFQIDISTGDSITPKEIEYEYRLCFEDETINLLSYNIETLLAEKIETILDRSITNTRMRDFYDLYMIYNVKKDLIDYDNLKLAISSTMNYRKTDFLLKNVKLIIVSLADDNYMKELWSNYKKNNTYVLSIEFKDTLDVLAFILKRIGLLT